MRVLVNTRFLLKNNLEGMGRFSYEILKRLVKAHPEIDFYFLFDRKFDSSFIFSDNVTPIIVPPPARHPFLWFIWFEYSIPAIIKKIKPDLFISTDGYLSLRSTTKTLLFWHDLSYLHFPDHVSYFARKYYQLFVPLFLNRADGIVTFSSHSAKEIIDRMNVPASKITTSSGASRSEFKPAGSFVQDAIRKKISGGAPYFLYVGALHPRKNVEAIINAFDIFKKDTGSDLKLIIAGRFAWKYKNILRAYNSALFRNEIIFSGHVDIELTSIVASAYALIYPSFYEGYGLPVIESICCSIPVITSSTSSLPEVCGDAGLLVDPNSLLSITDAMKKIFYEKELYDKLKGNCVAQCKKFDWAKTAQDVYRAMMALM